MNRLILLLFILSQASFVKAQNNNNDIVYKGEGFYLKYINPETQEVVTAIPYGKAPYIYYDVFFKTYDILYEGIEGGTERMKLVFLKQEENYTEMMDTFDNKFMVFNYINEKKSLVILSHRMVNGMIVCFVIEGVQKQ